MENSVLELRRAIALALSIVLIGIAVALSLSSLEFAFAAGDTPSGHDHFFSCIANTGTALTSLFIALAMAAQLLVSSQRGIYLGGWLC